MAEARVILVVGANARNLELLAEFLGREGYCVERCESVETCDQTLCCRKVALALVDIAGFDLRMWDGCDRLCGLHIPIVVLARRADRRVREAWLAHGARAVLAKPLSARELLGNIRLVLGPCA